jgi:hypothetical protein
LNCAIKRSRPWNVKKKKTSHPVIAAMSTARAKVFAVNASVTTSKAGSFPDAVFRPMLKRHGTDLSIILLG